MKSGDKVKYVGCLSNCRCRNLSEEDQRLLAQFLPGKLHLGREVVVSRLTDNLCEAAIPQINGVWLISFKDHFEAIL